MTLVVSPDAPSKLNHTAVYLLSLPKAELHVHLEGTVDYQLLRKLAVQNDVNLSSPTMLSGNILVNPPKHLDRQMPDLHDFADFIGLYLKISSVIKQREDIIQIAKSYCQTAKAQNITSSWVYFSPSTFVALGHDLDPLFAGLKAAEEIAKEEFGMSIVWIFDIVRNSTLAPELTLECACEAKRRGVTVSAIGLAGDEQQRRARDFKSVFAEARRRGFQTLAHAGETCGPESIREVIDELAPQRIGHGISVIYDKSLMRELVDRQIPFEVSPWSNICLKNSTAQNHPIFEMVAAGLNVIIAADDPGIFGRDLVENYLFAYQTGVTSDALEQIAERSLVTAQ